MSFLELHMYRWLITHILAHNERWGGRYEKVTMREFFDN
jgi:hypothetical protein